MRLFTPLANRRIAWLWVGQVGSVIGDNLYGVALAWFAVSLVGGENSPVAVRTEIIEALRDREGADGNFRVAARKCARGAAVRVVDGIFASTIRFFDTMSESDRVSVLLDLLGRRVRVMLDAESIAAA